jgi:hypothetical protein
VLRGGAPPPGGGGGGRGGGGGGGPARVPTRGDGWATIGPRGCAWE